MSLVVLVTAVISLLSVWFYPSLHDFMAGNAMWNGIRDFADEFEVDTIDTLDNLPSLPEKSILILIPYVEFSEESMAKIKSFVENGGILLLMDDYGFGNEILDYLDVSLRFTGTPLLDPLFCHKNQWMPKTTDFTNDIVSLGIEVVTMNHAASLAGVDSSEAIAYSSPESYLDMNDNRNRDEGEPSGPFTVAAKTNYGRGLIIAISDPSVVISSMLKQYDNNLFVQYLINIRGEPENIFLDQSHLSKTPLDTSKTSLSGIREFVSNPYVLAGVIGMIFVVISKYTLRKGETVG